MRFNHDIRYINTCLIRYVYIVQKYNKKAAKDTVNITSHGHDGMIPATATANVLKPSTTAQKKARGELVTAMTKARAHETIQLTIVQIIENIHIIASHR